MRTVRLWLGGALAGLGFLVMLIGVGPLGWPGIPVFLVGVVLILGASRGAKRAFLTAARNDPVLLGRLRGWLRRRARRRRP